MSEFKNRRLTKELLDEVRSINGFPIGKEEDIIVLSDPPYFTACPNPFIKDFIEKHGKPYDPENDDYHREPFAADVSEGKNDPIYYAHTYYTKVPHKAVMRYILHYTDPGDIVFDGFCGSGMIGIAAKMCDSPEYRYKIQIEKEMPYVKLGLRNVILSDLSPAATFIAYNYNSHVNVKKFGDETRQIIETIKKEYDWIYKTNHVINGETQYTTNISGTKEPVVGEINYVVWSDVYSCPNCSIELNSWKITVDEEKRRIKKDLHCPSCDTLLKKRAMDRVFITVLDQKLGKTIKKAKQIPVLINYIVKDKRNNKVKKYDKSPDEADLNLLKKIEGINIPYWYPINALPKGINTEQPKKSHNFYYVHQFFTKRNLLIIAKLFNESRNASYRHQFLFVLTSFLVKTGSLFHNIGFKNGSLNLAGAVPNVLYIPSTLAERNIFILMLRKLDSILKLYSSTINKDNFIISTQSNTNLLNVPSNSVDYIFTDPPFGGNIMYSELNYIWESWLEVYTDNNKEAIINKIQNKGLLEYQNLMEQCFKENYRILKPNRWMTVEFHNSKNSVWISIQEALMRAGFVIADVRVLDKKQGTFKQMTTTSAVKQDLIITSYKPNEDLEKKIILRKSSVEVVWHFIRQHLKHLPIFVEKDSIVEIVTERQNFLLYDRMVAFHVQRGISVPISASEFYAGLKQRFPIRDDMYFTVDQIHEYDRKRMNAKRVEQISLFVHDERSAIRWLRQELSREHLTYQDIQPKFLMELYKEKHEDLPELSEILEQNFLQDDEGRWYIPNISREADLEKLREKTLLREFQEYKDAKGRLRLFRSEAVRIGFSKCWQEGDYEIIVEVAEKLPTRFLQEEPTLLMYYDNAIMLIQE